MPLIVNVMGFTPRARWRRSSRRSATRDEVAGARAQRLVPERRDRADHGRRPGARRRRCVDAVRPLTAQAADRQADARTATSPADVAAAAEAARRRRRLAHQHAARHGARTRGAPASRGSAAAPAGCPARRSARSRSRRSREVARARRDPDRRDGRRPERTSRPRPARTRARRRRGRHGVVPRPARRAPGSPPSSAEIPANSGVSADARTVGPRAHST